MRGHDSKRFVGKRGEKRKSRERDSLIKLINCRLLKLTAKLGQKLFIQHTLYKWLFRPGQPRRRTVQEDDQILCGKCCRRFQWERICVIISEFITSLRPLCCQLTDGYEPVPCHRILHFTSSLAAHMLTAVSHFKLCLDGWRSIARHFPFSQMVDSIGKENPQWSGCSG